MSWVQRLAVGLIGEVYAREWIRRFHMEKLKVTVSDQCWVSEYRNNTLGEKLGCDNLGFDFAVKLRSMTYYYDVKASQGDPCAFQLGPTEIIAAHRFRKDRDHKYRILYVSHGTQSANTRIWLLPNPIAETGF